jgi:alpha-galactosidase
VGSPADWVRPTANSWRTGGDISPHWDAVLYQLDSFAEFGALNLSAPGGWGDPDMLEVGVVIHSDVPQFLTEPEAEAHFALWCLLKAPLMMGADPTLMDEAARKLLLNEHAIRINQDPLGASAKRVLHSEDSDVWSVELQSGEVAAVLLNRGDSSLTVAVNFTDLGLSNRVAVRDVWSQSSLGQFSDQYQQELSAHSAAFVSLAGVQEISV